MPALCACKRNATMPLAPRSEKALRGVHPALDAIVRRACEKGARFHVTCGCRSIDEQRNLVAAGKSKTMRSRHLTGHAVDLVAIDPDGSISYDLADMAALNVIMQRAAHELGHAIEWGGDWKSFRDTPHWQLPWADYPADDVLPPRADYPADDALPPIEHVKDPQKERVKEAVHTSNTIFGGLIALFGSLIGWLETAVQVGLDTVAEMTKLDPLKALSPHVKIAGGVLVLAGLALVISRRIDAARKGKIG